MAFATQYRAARIELWPAVRRRDSVVAPQVWRCLLAEARALVAPARAVRDVAATRSMDDANAACLRSRRHT